MKVEYDSDARYQLYDAPYDQTQFCEGDFAAGSPDSGYASPPSMVYSEGDYEHGVTHYDYSVYAHDTSPYTPPTGHMSPAIYAPTPIRPVATPADPYVHRSSVTHVAAAPTEYAYQDLSAVHAAVPSATHEQAFADPIAAAAAPQLPLAITETSGIPAAPSLTLYVLYILNSTRLPVLTY